MIITDLPAETLDHIASALDSDTDIKNLAAACTQLRLVLSPNHTQFRVIRAPLISPIWKKIAENRLLARNIRVLEIGSVEDLMCYCHDGDAKFDKPAIPAIFQGPEVPSVPMCDVYKDDADVDRRYKGTKHGMDLYAERILVSALKGMSGLTSFRWACSSPLINRNQEDDIWITLAKYCPSLNAIGVLDRRVWWAESLNPDFYLIKELKSFSLYTDRSDGFNVLPSAAKCAEMLIRKCPDLEVLKLGYDTHRVPITYVPASPLFSGPSWTFLRELVLRCFRCISTELASFLASHPTVEILSLKSSRIDHFVERLPPGVLVLPPDALPRLKRLSTDPGSALANSILDSTISTPRPLESINGSLLDDAFLDSLEHSGSGLGLEELIAMYNDDLNRLLPRLSSIAPNLQWLDISHYPGLRLDRSLYTLFGQFPRLRTLRGFRFVESRCKPASQNAENIRALVTACPNLQRISWFRGHMLDAGYSVLIERNDSDVTWSVRKLSLNGVEGSVKAARGQRGSGRFQL